MLLFLQNHIIDAIGQILNNSTPVLRPRIIGESLEIRAGSFYYFLIAVTKGILTTFAVIVPSGDSTISVVPRSEYSISTIA